MLYLWTRNYSQIIGTCPGHHGQLISQNCVLTKIRAEPPPPPPPPPPLRSRQVQCVVRRRFTSRQVQCVVRRRFTSLQVQCVVRRRFTSRQVQCVVRRRFTSRQVQCVVRRRFTSLQVQCVVRRRFTKKAKSDVIQSRNTFKKIFILKQSISITQIHTAYDFMKKEVLTIVVLCFLIFRIVKRSKIL